MALYLDANFNFNPFKRDYGSFEQFGINGPAARENSHPWIRTNFSVFPPLHGHLCQLFYPFPTTHAIIRIHDLVYKIPTTLNIIKPFGVLSRGLNVES